jgi:plasmid maintenance system antidote protein VapI
MEITTYSKGARDTIMTRAAGAVARRAFNKTLPHLATVLQNAMQEHGFTAHSLAEKSAVPVEEIQDLLERRRVINAKQSEQLGRAFGFGKQRFYRIHQAWMESGGV